MINRKGSQGTGNPILSDYDAWAEFIQTKTKTTPINNTDTFSFECQKCASCCRNANLSIFYEAIDIYNLMKRLHNETGKKQDIDKILDEYATVVYMDEVNRFPLLAVKTKAHMDTCVFLRSGKCSIYDSRPLVCRVYPLILSYTDCGEELHITKEYTHHFTGETVTAGQYIDKVYTDEAREYLKLKDHYYLLMFETLRSFTPECWESSRVILLSMEYFSYNIDAPFIPQYKDNMSMLIGQLKSILRYY